MSEKRKQVNYYFNAGKDVIGRLQLNPDNIVTTREHRGIEVTSVKPKGDYYLLKIIGTFFIWWGIILGIILFPMLGAFGMYVNWGLLLLMSLGIALVPFIFFVIIPQALKIRRKDTIEIINLRNR